MAIIKRDVMNPHKLEVVTPDQALDESMHIAALGYETIGETTEMEHKELVRIVGRLLNSLSSRGVLSDKEIIDLLKCHTLEYGSPT